MFHPPGGTEAMGLSGTMAFQHHGAGGFWREFGVPVFLLLPFPPAIISTRDPQVPMSTETTISLILFFGALLLVWRTRRGLYQEREKAQAREALPEPVLNPAVDLAVDPPPEPVAALKTNPVGGSLEGEAEPLAPEKATEEALEKSPGEINGETLADPEKKSGAEVDQKPAVMTDSGLTPEPIPFHQKKPEEKTALGGAGKPKTGDREDSKTRMGREKPPDKPLRTVSGKKTVTGAGTEIFAGPGPTMDSAVERGGDGVLPPRALNPEARVPRSGWVGVVREPAVERPIRSGSMPETRAAGQSPRPHAAINPVLKNPAEKKSSGEKPAVKNPAVKLPTGKTPPDKTD